MKTITAFLVVLATALFLWGVTSGSLQPPENHRHINLPTHNPNLPFSDAVLVGDTLYIAGRIGIDPQTGRPPQKVEDEVRLLLDGFQAVLKGAEMSMDHLVQVQVFCPDLTLYDSFNGIYRTYFKKDFPARAFIGSGPLLRGGRFEMLGIAVR